MASNLVQAVGSKVAQAMGDSVAEKVKIVGDKIKDTLGQTGSSTEQEKQQEPPRTPEEVIEHTFASTNKLMVKQKFEALEALTNAAVNLLGLGLCAMGVAEFTNKYDAFTDDGNGLKFHVTETSEQFGWTGRCLCRPNHKLQLHVFHHQDEGHEIMVLDRGCKWAWCFSCCECCQQELVAKTVDKNKGNATKTLAVIREPFLGGNGLSPSLQVMERDVRNVSASASGHHKKKRDDDEDDEDNPVIATIQANAVCCIGGLCCDHTFQVLDNHGRVIGTIVKEKPQDAPQTVLELISDADYYTLTVPPDMPAQHKAALFSALHLIDYWLFEGEGDCTMNLIRQSVAVKCCSLYCCGCIVPCGCRRYGRCCWCPMITG